MEVLRERVQERVEADDVHDEGDLRHHREKGQLRRAPHVGPLDVLALERRGSGTTRHQARQERGRRAGGRVLLFAVGRGGGEVVGWLNTTGTCETVRNNTSTA